MPISQASAPFMTVSLDAPHEEQDDQNEQNQPEPARGRVAPATGITPGGQRSDEKQDEQDDENCIHEDGSRRSLTFG